jgi:DNA-binding NarL/FixJ family response regulator
VKSQFNFSCPAPDRKGLSLKVQPNPIRVAVVDDEPTMRSVLQDLITDHPAFELVGSGTTADEAVELARTLRPDVILLDVKLPGGGPNAARGILACSPGTTVVAISAYGDRNSISQMEAAGASAYLVKGKASMLDIVSTIEQAAETPETSSTD